ncbi:aromatic acid exporter family protein, partial [Enterococcus faecalis]
IGVGLALLPNSYMPDTEKRLREDQEVIETMFRKILREMELHLNNAAGERNLVMHFADLKTIIRTGETWAKNHAENQLL